MGFVFAHGGVGLLPDHEAIMFLMPALPALFVATVLIGAALDKRGTLGDAGRTVAVHTPLAIIAAVLSLAAAGIHFAVISEHLEEDVLFGVLFFALGWFQLVWAQVYVVWPRRSIAALAVLVNLGAVVVWIMSRTVGLPIGPEAWVPEQVGFSDVLASSLEIGIIGLMLPTLLGERYASALSARMPIQKAFVLSAFMVIAVGLLTAMALVPPAFEFLAFS
ncbi:MAG TPA: hypothetical protein VM284_04705 [Candidatus Limnocylindria bacterium]|nr:hypothetical protein [Candidatus Limnocylindria bacterium]